MKSKLLFIFVCVLISLALFGCSHSKINFYRESEVQQFMNKTLNPNNGKATTTRSSSGVVIYKDNTVNDTTGGGADFGPKDIDFSLPIK